MSVEHTFPSEILFADGFQVSPRMPGVVATSLGVQDSSPQMVRRYSEYILESYTGKLVEITLASGNLKILRRFLKHTLGLQPFWIVPHNYADFYEEIPGEITDGSRTTFILPFQSGGSGPAPSDLMIFLAGAVQISNYTVRPITNYLPDNEANAVSSVGKVTAYGTCTLLRRTEMSADGPACFWVQPTGAQTNVGYHLDESDSPDMSDFDSGSAELTVVASVRGAGDFVIQTEFFNSSHGSLGSATQSSSVEGDAAEFLQITKTETAPSGTAYIEIDVIRTSTASAEPFAVGCVGVLPGDLTRWFLKTECPYGVEFDSAPSENLRISSTATALLMARVVFSDPSTMWKLYYDGDAYPKGFTLHQEPDNAG